MSGFTLSNKWYGRVKYAITIVLPAFATFYFAVGLPNADQVLGWIAATTTFLGGIFGISTRNYKKANPEPVLAGEWQVQVDEGGPTGAMHLNLDAPPEAVVEQQEVKFRISPVSQIEPS